MTKNKKGLSKGTNMLVVLLLILAVIWTIDLFLVNFISLGIDVIDISTRCMDINIEIISVSCGIADCNVLLKGSGTEEKIDGIILSFSGPSATSNILLDSKNSIPPVKDLEQLQPVSINAPNIIANLGGTPNRVEAIAYFEDRYGTPQLCSQSTIFTF